MSRLRCPATGKIVFWDKHDAMKALRRSAGSRRKTRTAQRYAKISGKGVVGAPAARREHRAYECEWCGSWHLTSSRAHSVDVPTVSIGGWEA